MQYESVQSHRVYPVGFQVAIKRQVSQAQSTYEIVGDQGGERSQQRCNLKGDGIGYKESIYA